MNSMVFENEMDNETSDMTSLSNTNKNRFKTLKNLSTARWQLDCMLWK